MEITWYSAAGLVMREGDAAIAFDPFFGMPVGCFIDKNLSSLPKKDFADVTDVFVTHGHVDHIYYLPELCGASRFRIHCTPAPRKTLMRRGVPPERIVPAAANGTDVVPSFTVTAYQGRHCQFDLPIVLQTVFRKGFFRHPVHLIRLLWEIRRFPENGEILMYEVSCGEKRIQVLGSLGLDAHTDYPTDADILVLPFQGRSDLEAYALGVVRRLKPRMVFLDHYDNAFPPISDEVDTEDFIKMLSEQEHIPCRAMVKGRNIHVETQKTLGRPQAWTPGQGCTRPAGGYGAADAQTHRLRGLSQRDNRRDRAGKVSEKKNRDWTIKSLSSLYDHHARPHNGEAPTHEPVRFMKLVKPRPPSSSLP